MVSYKEELASLDEEFHGLCRELEAATNRFRRSGGQESIWM